MRALCSSVCPSSFLTNSPRITVLRIPSPIGTGFAPGCRSSKEECYSLPYRNKRKVFLFLIRVTLRPRVFDLHYYLKVCPSRARGGPVSTHQCHSPGRWEGKNYPEGLNSPVPVTAQEVQPHSGLLYSHPHWPELFVQEPGSHSHFFSPRASFSPHWEHLYPSCTLCQPQVLRLQHSEDTTSAHILENNWALVRRVTVGSSMSPESSYVSGLVAHWWTLEVVGS